MRDRFELRPQQAILLVTTLLLAMALSGCGSPGVHGGGAGHLGHLDGPTTTAEN